MPTPPDLTDYNPLVIYDTDATDLVNRAVLDAESKVPDWNPVDGNWEMVLLEAQALIVAELVFAINRLPDATIAGVLQLLGVTVNQGAPAHATATFTLSDSLGHTIPAGTVVALTVGDDQLTFTTDSDLTVAFGATTGTTAITTVDNTAAANGAVAGTALTVVSAVPYVETAALATAVSAGTDQETDSDFINRGVQRFARLNDTLVLADHFTDEALTFPQVVRATTVDNWNADLSTTAAGHVTVAVLGAAGATLSTGDKATILADLQAKSLVNLTVHVIDPTVTTVAVTVSLHSVPGQDTAVVHDAAVTAIRSYLSTDTWPWSGTVRKNKLLNVIENVDGVDYVDTLTAPAGDVTLTGAAPLATAGAISVTVTPS